MLCILNRNTDPYFNLAAEEYILKNFQDDCFMLYQNENAIIVGKHQNAISEINLDYVQENNIKVVRRISGGGTVFHDLGNLNFSFFMAGEEGNLINFKKFTRPIIEFLQKNGVDAEYGKRNDLVVRGKKISGNAEHIWKKRTLHHGTILFSSELNKLTAALKVNPLKFTDKSVKSVRSRVTNLSDHLEEKMDVSVFSEKLMDYVKEEFSVPELYEFADDDLRGIQDLKDNKFASWEWNFGYSPSYEFKRTAEFKSGNVDILLKTSKGIISDIKFTSNFFLNDSMSDLEKELIGRKHDRKSIKKFLNEDIENLKYLTPDELLEVLF